MTTRKFNLLTVAMTTIAAISAIHINPNEVNAANQLHTVQAGEYLYVIAPQYGVTVDDLIEWNQLSSIELQVGDQLIVAPSSSDNSNTTGSEVDSEQDPISEAAPSESYYIVAAGDYLYKIAQQFGTTVDAIKEANQLASNHLQIGDQLIIPGEVTEQMPVETAPSQPEQYYTVQAGDNLYRIALNYNVSLDTLIANNQLTSHWVYPGQRLIISNDASIPNEDNSNKPENSDNIYTVVPGDYLYKIANKFNTTVDALKAANQMTDNFLQVGDQLIIPTGHHSDNNIESNTPAPAQQSYTVVTGDYLYKIANKFGVSVEALMQANQLTNTSLQVGDTLTIPSISGGINQDQSEPNFNAPQPGDSAYMPNMTLINQKFTRLSTAIDYANAHFDYKMHDNYYVKYHDSGYILYFQMK